MARHENTIWNLQDRPNNEQEILGVLIDIRRDMIAIRRRIECPNVQAGFVAMQQVARNTSKKRKKRTPK